MPFVLHQLVGLPVNCEYLGCCNGASSRIRQPEFGLQNLHWRLDDQSSHGISELHERRISIGSRNNYSVRVRRVVIERLHLLPRPIIASSCGGLAYLSRTTSRKSNVTSTNTGVRRNMSNKMRLVLVTFLMQKVAIHIIARGCVKSSTMA